MCGIVGTIGHVPERALRDRAVDSLRARGPDGEGQWFSERPLAWFGHRRLAIIDLGESGRQPMSHPERPDLVIIFNGEIYNHPALRTELEGKGHRFRSTSDTEVILHAYVAWGERLVDRIEGMFAFALFDGAERKLLLARDPVGQKPLYFKQAGSTLAFASTPDALRLLDPTGTQLSSEAICYVLTLGYVPAPHSIWAGINSVRPGEYVVWQEGRPLRFERYWRPPDRVTGHADHKKKFAELFSMICAEHTVSDVPVGLFLSGGIDSTTVACALHDADLPLECFTLGFADSGHSEHAIAEATVRHLGFAGHRLTLATASVDELRDAVARSSPEPQGYSALLTMYAVAKLASAEMKVMLSGDGGDEVFGGYAWYTRSDARLGRRLVSLLRSLRTDSASEAAAYTMERFARRSVVHAHAMNVFRRFLPAEATELFAPLAPKFDDEAMLAPLEEYFVPSLPRQNALQRIDLMTFCSGSVLAKVDRMAMAHSLEVRAPFLDRRLIDWSLSRTAEHPRRGRQKPTLRQYLATRAPEAVLAHRKQGFGMRGLRRFDHRPLMGEISRSRMVRDGLLHKEFDRYVDPQTSLGRSRLWTLASVTSWYEHHV